MSEFLTKNSILTPQSKEFPLNKTAPFMLEIEGKQYPCASPKALQIMYKKLGGTMFQNTSFESFMTNDFHGPFEKTMQQIKSLAQYIDPRQLFDNNSRTN